jgi:hypothetical protein
MVGAVHIGRVVPSSINVFPFPLEGTHKPSDPESDPNQSIRSQSGNGIGSDLILKTVHEITVIRDVITRHGWRGASTLAFTFSGAPTDVKSLIVMPVMRAAKCVDERIAAGLASFQNNLLAEVILRDSFGFMVLPTPLHQSLVYPQTLRLNALPHATRLSQLIVGSGIFALKGLVRIMSIA